MLKRFAIYMCAVWLSLGLAWAQIDIDEWMLEGEKAYSIGDVVDAMSWFRKAAKQGNAPAQVRLAGLLDASEQNTLAVEWLRRAADQGYAEGEYELGVMYAAGEGVEKNISEAYSWIEKSALKGFSPAVRALVHAYEQGGLGVDVDYEKTILWLYRGVEMEDQWSVRHLSEAYRDGTLGLSPDPAQATALEETLKQLKGE